MYCQNVIFKLFKLFIKCISHVFEFQFSISKLCPVIIDFKLIIICVDIFYIYIFCLFLADGAASEHRFSEYSFPSMQRCQLC